MPRQTLLIAIALLIPAARAVHADWFTDTWNSGLRVYHRNKCWPQPFVQSDRRDVHQPFEAMAYAGWRQQNMLGGHHFQPGSDQLTEAGRLKAYWILTQNPPQRRTVFVQRGQTQNATSARMHAVHQLAGQILPPGYQADVQETNLAFQSRSADIVDRTNVRFREAMPAPVLPAAAPDGGLQ